MGLSSFVGGVIAHLRLVFCNSRSASSAVLLLALFVCHLVVVAFLYISADPTLRGSTVDDFAKATGMDGSGVGQWCSETAEARHAWRSIHGTTGASRTQADPAAYAVEASVAVEWDLCPYPLRPSDAAATSRTDLGRRCHERAGSRDGSHLLCDLVDATAASTAFGQPPDDGASDRGKTAPPTSASLGVAAPLRCLLRATSTTDPTPTIEGLAPGGDLALDAIPSAEATSRFEAAFAGGAPRCAIWAGTLGGRGIASIAALLDAAPYADLTTTPNIQTIPAGQRGGGAVSGHDSHDIPKVIRRAAAAADATLLAKRAADAASLAAVLETDERRAGAVSTPVRWWHVDGAWWLQAPPAARAAALALLSPHSTRESAAVPPSVGRSLLTSEMVDIVLVSLPAGAPRTPGGDAHAAGNPRVRVRLSAAARVAENIAVASCAAPLAVVVSVAAPSVPPDAAVVDEEVLGEPPVASGVPYAYRMWADGPLIVASQCAADAPLPVVLHAAPHAAWVDLL